MGMYMYVHLKNYIDLLKNILNHQLRLLLVYVFLVSTNDSGLVPSRHPLSQWPWLPPWNSCPQNTPIDAWPWIDGQCQVRPSTTGKYEHGTDLGIGYLLITYHIPIYNIS
jgi:hypothetical protein